MLCQHCKKKESTGFLIHLCDPCFDEWEKKVKQDPKSADIEPLDMSIKFQSQGGFVPDNAKGVKIRYDGNDVKVDIIK